MGLKNTDNTVIMNNQTYVKLDYITGNKIGTIDRLKIVSDYQKKMNDNSKQLDPKFAEIIDKHFWDMIK